LDTAPGVEPPRRLTDRVIDRQMQLGVLLVGLLMAAAAAAAPGGARPAAQPGLRHHP
jgi:hypothetical protein